MKPLFKRQINYFKIVTALGIGTSNFFGISLAFGDALTNNQSNSTYSAARIEAPQYVPDSIPDHIVGDIGAAIYTSKLNIGSYGTQSLVLPYAFFDYKRFFARIDTFGIKTVPVGYGYFELAGRISLDDYTLKSTINGVTVNKQDPIPLGIGTFQETPIGAFFFNAFQDAGKSRGQLYELSYFGEIETVRQIKLYPQLGIERQSSQYASYYYGVSQSEAFTTGYRSYNVGASNNPMIGMMLEIPIIDNWYLNFYGKRKWMGSNIIHSPVMTKSFQDNIFMMVAYRFK